MRVLVTGGRGFFGQHIVVALSARGHETIAGDKQLADLRNPDEVRYALYSTRPDVVIHCAAHVGGIGLNAKKPGELFYDNMLMGLHIMEQARLRGVKKFVQIGTSCEYPHNTPVPFDESYLWHGYPDKITGPYGIAKKALLVMGQAYRKQYGFNTIHLIPTNLYGPGDHYNTTNAHVIPSLICKFVDALWYDASSVEIWGTGKATREFIYIKDAAEAVVLAMENYDGDEPVNIGTGVETSITELVEMIASKIGYKGEIVFNASKPEGQPRRYLNPWKAFRAFGFLAKTKLSEGLDETISAYLKLQA